jgi:hypothetical protein
MPRKKKTAPPAEPENTVTIGGNTWAPKLPRSFTLRQDLIIAIGNNPRRAAAAALGLCWAGPNAPGAQYNRANWDALQYGGQVMDELVERGIDWGEVYAAGMVCLSKLVDIHVSEAEVKDAENFTDAPAG